MTIDKAIELLNTAKEGWPVNNTEPYFKAMELGIEALELVGQIHIADGVLSGHLLPGETK